MTPCRSANVHGVARAPDANLMKTAYQLQRFQVTRRLHARAQDAEDAGVGASEQVRCHRGDGSGAEFGDEPAIQHRERLTGLRPEQEDERMVRRHSLVAQDRT